MGYLQNNGKASGWIKYAVAIAAATVTLITILCLFRYSDTVLGYFKGISLNNGGDSGEVTGGMEGMLDKTEETSFSDREDESETKEKTDEIMTEPEVGVIDRDLSLAERGDSYLINYTEKNIDVEGLLEMGFQGGRYSYTEQPVVMILHTHTSEGYFDLDPSDPIHIMTKSVVSVGEGIAYELNKRGIPTVHCTVIHDGDGNNPYENAADTIKTMLRIYPTIKYIIDLHRMAELDGDGNMIRTVSDVGSAQLRVTVSAEGQMAKEALALALGLRRELNSDGRRLCMPTVLTDNRYNADLSRYYLKLDVGSLGNFADEAVAAGELFALAFAGLLKK